MEEQNSFIKKQGILRKIAIFILAVAFVVFVGFYGFNWYKNYSLSRESRVNYENYKKAEKEYIAAMTADTYGGKTPEETLKLFIEALKAGDIELASKYFALETNSQDPDYLTRKKWEDGLRKIKEKNSLEEVISKLSQLKLTFKDEDGAVFKLFNSNKEVEVLLEMKMNKYSKVWKIESL